MVGILALGCREDFFRAWQIIFYKLRPGLALHQQQLVVGGQLAAELPSDFRDFRQRQIRSPALNKNAGKGGLRRHIFRRQLANTVQQLGRLPVVSAIGE